MNRPTISCEQALNQVFDYIDHELDAHDRETMAQHLETCRSCFSRVEFEQRLKDKLADLRKEEATTKVSNRIKSMIKSF